MKKIVYGILAVATVAGVVGLVATNSSAQSLLDRAARTEQTADSSGDNLLPVITAPDTVIVEAKVLPLREASLSMASSGIVVDVLVRDGQYVDAGQPLVKLNSARQEAAVAQAAANLRNAELQLAELRTPPREEEVTRAQSAIIGAQASLQKVLDGPGDAEITGARVELANAEAALRQAQSEFDEIAWRTDIGMLPQATSLEQATNNYVRAQANLDDVLAGANGSDVTNAQAQVQSAQADLDLLRAGATAETIAASEAQVDAAEAAMQDAQAALDQMSLEAPFAGTVATVNVEVGEQVSPGMAVVRLADLSGWRLETEDLTELNVVNVETGDRVEVRIDALSDVELPGRVTDILPVGENKLGDITYTVLIELDGTDERLLWNMTAETTILPEPVSARTAGKASPVPPPSLTEDVGEVNGRRLSQDDLLVQQAAAESLGEVEYGIDAPDQMVGKVTTRGANLNVRAGPGIQYGIVGSLASGTDVNVAARSEAGSWVWVHIPGRVAGWVAADYVQMDGNLTDLPVSNIVVDEATVQPVAYAPAATDLIDLQTSEFDVEHAAHDGSTLVFQASSGGTLYSYDMASSQLRSLTYGMDPAISPDGSTVAFVRDGGEHGLYLIDIDGKNERHIYGGGENLRAPSWSPDGEWIVFSRRTGSYDCRDLGGGLCFPDNPFLDSFGLVSQDETILSRVDYDGQRFDDLPTLNTARAAAWGDAGIVYQSAAGIQLTGDGPGNTTSPVASAYRYQDPDIQPEGNLVVFHSLEGNHREIYTVGADGSGLQPLTRPQDLLAKEYPQNVAPDWNSGGTQIAFLSNRAEDGTVEEWGIWLMDADGANLQRLPIEAEITYDFQNEQVLSW